MSLLFIEKVRENRTAFERGVRGIASRLAINPDWLMALMNSETGGTFSPSIRNAAGSGATGLIQFMPGTARSLGTTTDALAGMSNVEQLTWVEKYLTSFNKPILDYDDLYFIVFYPAAMGRPDDWAFPSAIYSQNRGVDVNRDGIITVGDFKVWIRKHVPIGYELTTFVSKEGREQAIFFFVVVAVVTMAFAGYMILKKD